MCKPDSAQPANLAPVTISVAIGLVAGCGDDNTPTGPTTGGGNGGGGGTTVPATTDVTVGDIFFESDRNGTSKRPSTPWRSTGP